MNNSTSEIEKFFGTSADRFAESAMENAKAANDHKMMISKWIMTAALGAVGFEFTMIGKSGVNTFTIYFAFWCLSFSVILGGIESYLNYKYHEKYSNTMKEIHMLCMSFAYVNTQPNSVEKQSLMELSNSWSEIERNRHSEWGIVLTQSFLLFVGVYATLMTLIF